MPRCSSYSVGFVILVTPEPSVVRAAMMAGIAMLAVLLAIGCGSGSTPAPEDPSAGIESSFTLKVLRNTGENPFSLLAYECDECSFAQHAELEPPPGWTKAPAQVILPIGDLRSRPSVDDAPSSIDLIPEIPGDDFTLIAKEND